MQRTSLERRVDMPAVLKDRYGGTWRYQYGEMYGSIQLTRRRPQDRLLPQAEGGVLRHYADISQ